MYKKEFGKRSKMKFESPEIYWETLGFLAKSDGSIAIVWERNEEQGAWGSEGRIHCHSNLAKFTLPLQRKFTRGRARKVLHRINCNEFVNDIKTIHAFEFGEIQPTARI
jgi:hypothetical protein